LSKHIIPGYVKHYTFGTLPLVVGQNNKLTNVSPTQSSTEDKEQYHGDWDQGCSS